MSRQKQDRSPSVYAIHNPPIEDFLESSKRLARVGSDFLKVDVATALTFCQVALDAKDPTKIDRNRQAARKAYDTVTRFMGRMQISDEDRLDLTQNLKRLKAELRKLGEKV